MHIYVKLFIFLQKYMLFSVFYNQIYQLSSNFCLLSHHYNKQSGYDLHHIWLGIDTFYPLVQPVLGYIC